MFCSFMLRCSQLMYDEQISITLCIFMWTYFSKLLSSVHPKLMFGINVPGLRHMTPAHEINVMREFMSEVSIIESMLNLYFSKCMLFQKANSHHGTLWFFVSEIIRENMNIVLSIKIIKFDDDGSHYQRYGRIRWAKTFRFICL